MLKRTSIEWTVCALTILGVAGAPQISADQHLLQASEAEQVAFVTSVLDQGLPAESAGRMVVLQRNRSSLVLPLIEAKIEEVLKSNNPHECFKSPSVDPQRFVYLAASAIAYAGDDEALKQIEKLVRLDEKRFCQYVVSTLLDARDWHNPFTVAYHGFDLHDPAVDLRMVTWIESQLSSPEPSTVTDAKRCWAEALVDKYGGAPTETQWAKDPIITGLKPALAETLHNEMMRMAVDVLAKRSAK